MKKGKDKEKDKTKEKNIKVKAKAKVKLKGALRNYMFWPVWLTVLLLCAVLGIYVVSKEAAAVLMFFTALYFAVASLLTT